MTDHWFGRQAPATAPVAWGARAIYGRDGYIDLLPDRQQGIGVLEARLLLSAFLNTYALPRLREEYPRSENDLLMFEHDGWHLEASTHNNSGYLYIGAWPVGAEVPTVESAKWLPAPKPRTRKQAREGIGARRILPWK